MNRVLFLVKNYIGFGHIRRTLLIADQIRALSPDVEIIFISQAKSLLLFQNKPYKVINFPFLHRLPNNACASVYAELLNKIITALHPTIIIEDTYPDEWYYSLSGLQNIPKILILRRIDPIAFDDFRKEGFFSFYDRILLVQDREEFLAEHHVPQCVLLATLSDTFRFVGPVIHHPSDTEIISAKEKYGRLDKKLVVVNAGAGGDHFNDAYCEKLFSNVYNISCRLLEQGVSDVHFIFITGPYFRANYVDSTIVTIIDYEPYLSALLKIADVAILRPGFNVTQEALAGSSNIILVPGVSYMESQHFYAQYLSKKYPGVQVGNCDDINSLYQLIEDSLNKGPAFRSDQIEIGQKEAARAILDDSEINKQYHKWLQQCTGSRLFFLIGGIDHEFNFGKIEEDFINSIPIINRNFEQYGSQSVVDLNVLSDYCNIDLLKQRQKPTTVFMHSTAPINLTPETLITMGAKLLLYTKKTSFGVMASEWCQHYDPGKYGMLDIELYHFEVLPGYDLKPQLMYRVYKLLSKENPISIYFDLSLLVTREEIDAFFKDLREWLKTTGCNLLSLSQATNQFVKTHLA